jgi:hypothetical protein
MHSPIFFYTLRLLYYSSQKPHGAFIIINVPYSYRTGVLVWYFEVLLLVLGSGLIEVIVFAPELPGLFPHGQVKRGVQWKWCESPTAYLHRNSLVIRAIDRAVYHMGFI